MILEKIFSKKNEGSIEEIEIFVGDPVEGENWFETPVKISILDTKTRSIFGVSAIHSLHMALQFVSKILDAHITDGHRLFSSEPLLEEDEAEDVYLYKIGECKDS